MKLVIWLCVFRHKKRWGLSMCRLHFSVASAASRWLIHCVMLFIVGITGLYAWVKWPRHFTVMERNMKTQCNLIQHLSIFIMAPAESLFLLSHSLAGRRFPSVSFPWFPRVWQRADVTNGPGSCGERTGHHTLGLRDLGKGEETGAGTWGVKADLISHVSVVNTFKMFGFCFAFHHKAGRVQEIGAGRWMGVSTNNVI